jgi:hypothetical protein
MLDKSLKVAYRIADEYSMEYIYGENNSSLNENLEKYLKSMKNGPY